MPLYTDVLQFDSIIIIESLRLGERRTGRELYDNVLAPFSATNPALRSSYNRAGSKSEFLAYLDAARAQYFAVGSTAILHIEAHGDTEGLRLSNGDRVEWEELRRVLTDMNAASGLNLLVVMAMCKGWYLSKLLSPLQRAPVWGLIGPQEDVFDYHLYGAMEEFYSQLLTHGQGQNALTAMNLRVPDLKWHYHLQTAELLFCRVMQRYVQSSNADDLRDRENEIVAEIVRRRQLDITAAFEARPLARMLLQDHRRAYDFYRETFLMFDLFSENRDRMTLSYDDCMAVLKVDGDDAGSSF